jgi:hypothetical protein
MKKAVFVVFVMCLGCDGMDPSENIVPSEHGEETIALIRKRYDAKDSEIEEIAGAEEEESLSKESRRVPGLRILGAASRLDFKAYRDHPRLDVGLLNTLQKEHKDLIRPIFSSYRICYRLYNERIEPLTDRCEKEYPGEKDKLRAGKIKRYELIDMPPDERKEHLLWLKTYWEHVKDAREKGKVLARALVKDRSNPAVVHGLLVLGEVLYGRVVGWDENGRARFCGGIWDCPPLFADDEVEMVSEKVIPGERTKGDDEKEDYGFLRRIEETLKSL